MEGKLEKMLIVFTRQHCFNNNPSLASCVVHISRPCPQWYGQDKLEQPGLPQLGVLAGT
jgi:endonuclease III